MRFWWANWERLSMHICMHAGKQNGITLLLINSLLCSGTYCCFSYQPTMLVFFFFFLMRTIYNAFVELVAILLLLSVLIFWLQGMLDLCSPTRDWTLIPFIGRSSLNHWTTREVPFYFFLTQRSCWIINFERGEYPQGSWKTTSGSSVNTKLPATGDTVWWECTTRSLYSSQNGIGG